MAKLIMLIGIPGSGKTTYSKGLSEEFNANVISSDVVRQTYVGIDEKEVFPTVYRLCIEELKNNSFEESLYLALCPLWSSVVCT